jgi:hypothetical protein
MTTEVQRFVEYVALTLANFGYTTVDGPLTCISTISHQVSYCADACMYASKHVCAARWSFRDGSKVYVYSLVHSLQRRSCMAWEYTLIIMNTHMSVRTIDSQHIHAFTNTHGHAIHSTEAPRSWICIHLLTQRNIFMPTYHIQALIHGTAALQGIRAIVENEEAEPDERELHAFCTKGYDAA